LGCSPAHQFEALARAIEEESPAKGRDYIQRSVDGLGIGVGAEMIKTRVGRYVGGADLAWARQQQRRLMMAAFLCATRICTARNNRHARPFGPRGSSPPARTDRHHNADIGAA
jgi:hypothetical protein